MKSSNQSGSKAALNRSSASLADPSEAAKIAAHAASHAQPKCELCGLIIFCYQSLDTVAWYQAWKNCNTTLFTFLLWPEFCQGWKCSVFFCAS